jgi:GTPase Era involved in 16S rRNA processing
MDAQGRDKLDSPTMTKGTVTPNVFGRILIFGRVGSGKATVANKIAGKDLLEVSGSVKSALRQPQIRQCDMDSTAVTAGSVSYHFDVFDTEIPKLDSKVKLNCDKPRFCEEIHSVIFVISRNTSTNEDFEKFAPLLKCLPPELSAHSFLVVTGCEKDLLSEGYIQEYKTSLEGAAMASSLLKYCHKRLVYVGFPSAAEMLPSLYAQFKFVVKNSQDELRAMVRESGKKLLQSEQRTTHDVHLVQEESLDPEIIKSYDIIVESDVNLANEDTQQFRHKPLSSASALQRNIRRVLIFGRVGTGKSTIANSIMHQNCFTVNKSMQSLVRNPQIRVARADFEDITCHFALFDTNLPHLPMYVKDICDKPPFLEGINLILFVMNRNYTTGEDFEKFMPILKCLPKEISAHSILVVTGCEKDLLSKEQMEEYQTKLNASEKAKDLLRYCRKGQVFVGFPNEDETAPVLYAQYAPQVQECKKILRNLIRESPLMQFLRVHLK